MLISKQGFEPTSARVYREPVPRSASVLHVIRQLPNVNCLHLLILGLRVESDEKSFKNESSERFVPLTCLTLKGERIDSVDSITVPVLCKRNLDTTTSSFIGSVDSN